ncbi:MAG: arylamine N-acetyltransferase, partial [Eggerthellaceae bacterium]|nr:arylamine N-acetyltransferase [Eggerthellaceae bacterium]
MNDGAYLSIPDVRSYLDRIGVAAAKEPTRAYLDELVYAHQTHVPFENLDVFDKHAVPSLAVPDLFDKVVVRRRGGYCFELNGLFAALLRDLGFDVWPGMARVLLRPDPHPAITHRVSIVRFDDGLYMADVGFGGPQPGFALKIEEGFAQSGYGQTFCMAAAEKHWWEVRYKGSSEAERGVLKVCTVPSEEADFAALSFFQSQYELSSFRQRRIANIRTETGAHALENTTMTTFEQGRSSQRELEGNNQLDQALS